MLTDNDLLHQIDTELDTDPTIHSRQIGVVVKNGTAHLAGHVDSYWERCAAERAAWRVAHIQGVVNELRVEIPFANQRPDDDMALAAMTILEWNGLLPESIEVQVRDGVLTLGGEVARHDQIEEAERALAPLRGLVGIVNEIRLQPAAAPADVKARIESALKRSALVNSSHIKVQVHHGVVALQGTAHSRAERDEAVRAAWAVAGVAVVEDHIAIG
jgi:osmotically-inducible protein OsmY